jgi:hypothetical protein
MISELAAIVATKCRGDSTNFEKNVASKMPYVLKTAKTKTGHEP